MGITYVIEPDSGLVVLTAIGLVSNRDVRRAQEALQRDPVFRAEYR